MGIYSVQQAVSAIGVSHLVGRLQSEYNEAEALLSHCDKSCSLVQPAAREGGEALLGRRRGGRQLSRRKGKRRKEADVLQWYFILIKPHSKKTGKSGKLPCF